MQELVFAKNTVRIFNISTKSYKLKTLIKMISCADDLRELALLSIMLDKNKNSYSGEEYKKIIRTIANKIVELKAEKRKLHNE
ncbi:hypothetical protein SAE01_45920 [Segetibacter aerophilus]|uniref:Uncharacterized protein n=1 Tax=Segetibacter aerophilus TaxID=670293 RepID=A0A512BJF0_9BACT|nr:hypothetical protein SAE01_45920 [Segetibacter aerophilus]